MNNAWTVYFLDDPCLGKRSSWYQKQLQMDVVLDFITAEFKRNKTEANTQARGTGFPLCRLRSVRGSGSGRGRSGLHLHQHQQLHAPSPAVISPLTHPSKLTFWSPPATPLITFRLLLCPDLPAPPPPAIFVKAGIVKSIFSFNITLAVIWFPWSWRF